MRSASSFSFSKIWVLGFGFLGISLLWQIYDDFVNFLPLVLDFAPPERAGTYAGLYYLASQTASFVSSVLSGWLFDRLGNNYRLACLYSPIALVMAFILLWGVRCKAAATVREATAGPDR